MLSPALSSALVATTFMSLSMSSAVPPRERERRSSVSIIHIGCFTDSMQDRALTAATFTSDSMTVESCAAFCSTYTYFGVEYGKECYCANTRTSSSTSRPQSECYYACAGSSSESCGAGNRIDIYGGTSYVPPVVVTPSYQYTGCFFDSVNARALPDQMLAEDDMTIAMCAAHCVGSRYFGVEFGRECYCGSDRPSTSAPESDCYFACSGDASAHCGAGDRLNVYQINDGASSTTTATTTGSTTTTTSEMTSATTATATSSSSSLASTTTSSSPASAATDSHQGCFVDSASARVLPDLPFSNADMTVEMCAVHCAGFSYYGVEFGRECYCGSSIPTAQVSNSDCSYSCTGNSAQSCGAGDRIDVYKYATSTTASRIYQGCFVDAVGSRALPNNMISESDMTIDMCAVHCAGFLYYGVEFGRECYCGSSLPLVPAPESDCYYGCSGNSAQTCGAGDRINVYMLLADTTTTTTTTTTSTSSSSNTPILSPSSLVTTTSTALTTSATTSTAFPTTTTSTSGTPTTSSTTTTITSTALSTTTVKPSTTTTTAPTTTTTTSTTTTSAAPTCAKQYPAFATPAAVGRAQLATTPTTISDYQLRYFGFLDAVAIGSQATVVQSTSGVTGVDKMAYYKLPTNVITPAAFCADYGYLFHLPSGLCVTMPKTSSASPLYTGASYTLQLCGDCGTTQQPPQNQLFCRFYGNSACLLLIGDESSSYYGLNAVDGPATTVLENGNCIPLFHQNAR